MARFGSRQLPASATSSGHTSASPSERASPLKKVLVPLPSPSSEPLPPLTSTISTAVSTVTTAASGPSSPLNVGPVSVNPQKPNSHNPVQSQSQSQSQTQSQIQSQSQSQSTVAGSAADKSEPLRPAKPMGTKSSATGSTATTTVTSNSVRTEASGSGKRG